MVGRARLVDYRWMLKAIGFYYKSVVFSRLEFYLEFPAFS